MSLPVTIGEIPSTPGFTPTRAGVRRLYIERDRITDVHRVVFTPCDCTDTAWGPKDSPEVASDNLVAELMASPDSAEKLAALQAVQRLAADVLTVSAYLVSLRG